MSYFKCGSIQSLNILNIENEDIRLNGWCIYLNKSSIFLTLQCMCLPKKKQRRQKKRRYQEKKIPSEDMGLKVVFLFQENLKKHRKKMTKKKEMLWEEIKNCHIIGCSSLKGYIDEENWLKIRKNKEILVFLKMENCIRFLIKKKG